MLGLSEKSSDNLLSFFTGVRYSKRALQELNSITFLFDPNWEAGIGTKATLPLSIIYVKNQKEIMESEVNQKQIIFHNSVSRISGSSVTGGQTAVIADNIVNKPKTYVLDVIVPMTASDSNVMVGTINPYQTSNVTSFLARRTSDTAYTGALSWTVQGLRLIDIFYSLLSDLIYQGINAWKVGDPNWWKNAILNVMETPQYNKDSLDAMWQNRTIIKMKTWNDWRYKYVVIKDINISKEGTDSGVYTGTITLQEINIMTVRRTSNLKINGWSNKAVSLTGKAIKALINSQESK